MKHEKFCFNKKVGIISLVGIIFIVLVFISQSLTTTQTSTNSRASAPKSKSLAPNENWFGISVTSGKKCSFGIGCSWTESAPYNMPDYTSFGHCNWYGIMEKGVYCRNNSVADAFATAYGFSSGRNRYNASANAYCSYNGLGTKCVSTWGNDGLVKEFQNNPELECPYFYENSPTTTVNTTNGTNIADANNTSVTVRTGICQW